jgi:NitT/TauT family transport system ATP-binding protein
VFRPDLYDAALGDEGKPADMPETISAFAGPAFNASDIAAHLAAFEIARLKS